jgi:N-acetylmuramic acid 6-phosphate etherase
MNDDRITEMPSKYRHLEQMSSKEVLYHINDEDELVPIAVKKAIPEICLLVDAITEKMLNGGRLFYIGAGTSGRLGVLDASECPPTFGVTPEKVIGIMAGGNEALRFGIEDAEDKEDLGWQDLQKYDISTGDVVIGIAASGSTPYVIGALKESKKQGITTGCVVCNTNSPVAVQANFPVEVIVGPEFLTGSTRMKCGTAQKLVLNMISTAVMIGIGRVQDNVMINMEISNQKLLDRGVRMLMEKANLLDYDQAKEILLQNGSVNDVLETLKNAKS